jgi:DNA polymerase-3 subunit epsilon
MEPKLTDLPVLVIDCQATGANPKRGHPLELAWSVLGPGARVKPASRLVALPDGQSLSPQITRLTGIGNADLDRALSAKSVWRLLEEAACQVSPKGPHPCPAVIHFSRFEIPFLEMLYRTHGTRRIFPFDVICTWQIARRLLPGLPRRGLRAVAGYLGHHLEQLKRAEHHVQATAFIWQDFVKRLERRRGVETLDQLKAWLADESPHQTRHKSFRLPKAKRLSLPQGPGVYRFFGADGRTLYVGKASDLKARVNSHFTSLKTASEKNLELYSQVWDLTSESTESSLEAAMLEVDLIQKLRPAYNSALLPADDRVWYCSTDLMSASPERLESHPWGPVPTAEPALAAGRLGAVLAGEPTASAGIFDIQAKWAPTLVEIEQGIAVFDDRHGKAPPVSRGAWLLRLAARLERQRRADDLSKDEGAPDKTQESAQEGWTAEGVANALEASLRQAGRLLRRAWFLARLPGAGLRWQSRSGAWRELRVEDLKDAAFERGFHDRLRVLLTELGRLCSAGRPLELRIGAGQALNTQRLTSILTRF